MKQIKQKIKIIAVLIELIDSKMEHFGAIENKDSEEGHRISNEMLALEEDLLQRLNELQKMKL